MATKHLKGTDILLNLKEISIAAIDSYSSSGCSGRVSFSIDCETPQGYCEDPDFTGKLLILTVKKELQKGIYTLKVKFVREEGDRFD